jgi:FkbM family methyltransferase
LPTTVPIMLRLIARHPANRGRVPVALARAAAWQAYKRTIARPLTIRGYDGAVRIRAYPNSPEAGRFIYFSGVPDHAEAALLTRVLRQGDRFVDGGAHIGTYGLLAAALVGPSGQVDCFEAAPAALTRLCENIALNGFDNVRVHAAALSDRSTTVRFVIDRGSGAGNRIQTSLDADRATIESPSVTLDGAVSEAFLVCKLDIEGAEPLALKGAERWMAEGSPAVWIAEIQQRFIQRFGWSENELVEWLAERDYHPAVFDVDSNQLNMTTFDRARLRNNALFVRSSRLGELRERLASA